MSKAPRAAQARTTTRSPLAPAAAPPEFDPGLLLDAALPALGAPILAVCDGEGVILSVRGSDLKRRLGIGARGLVGRSLGDLLPPDRAASRLARYREVLRTRKPVRDEYLAPTPAGKLWLDVSLLPLPHAKGRPASVLAVLRTQWVSREKNNCLRQSREWLDTVFRDCPNAVSLWAHCPPSGRRLVECNDRYVEMSGRSREELFAAENLDALTTPHEMVSDVAARFSLGLPAGGIASWARPDGRENFYVWNAVPIEIDGTPYGLGIDIDVASMRFGSGPWRRDAALFAHVLSNSFDGINVCRMHPDGKRTLVMCNDRYVEMAGRSREELEAAGDIGPFVGAVPHIRPYVERRVRGENVVSGVAQWLRPDGRENCFEYVAAHITVGRDCYIVGVDRDITGRVLAERDQQAMQGRLVTAREEERRRIARELHDAIGQQALAVRLGLQAALKACPEAAASEGLQNVLRMCDDMIGSIRRITHGLYPPTLEALGLPAALRQLALSCGDRTVVTAKVQDLPEGVRLGLEIETALYRIAQEALSNALRHARASRITLRFSAFKAFAQVIVADNGVGFDPTACGSCGLGLSSMRERAKALGGDVEINSAPGRTDVIARIPQDHPDLPPRPVRPASRIAP